MSVSPAVFLTAAERDRASLTALDRGLRRRGVRTGVDPERVQTGDLLPEPVLQDLGACDAIVAVWSEAAAGDPLVAAHLETATSFGKREIRYTPNGDARFEELLSELYGDAPVPAPRAPSGVVVDPGRWRITDHYTPLDLDLVLGTDGRATGTGTARDRTGRVSGTWRYDAPHEELALDLRITIGLRPTPLTLLLCPSGRDGDRVHAADAHGLAAPHTYTVAAVPENGVGPP